MSDGHVARGTRSEQRRRYRSRQRRVQGSAPTATWPSGRGGRRSMCSAKARRRSWSAATPTCIGCSRTPRPSPPRCRAARAGSSSTSSWTRSSSPRWTASSTPVLRRLLMPAFSSRRIAQLQTSITGDRRRHARPHRGERPCASTACRTTARISSSTRCSTAMVHMDARRKAIFIAFHDLIPGDHLRQAGRAVVAGAAAAPSTAPWRRSRSSSTSAASRRAPDFISDLVNARDAGDKLNDRELFDQIFGICRRARCRPPAAPPAARSICSTPTTTSAAQLIRDPSLIPDAIEECLRLGSNGYFTFPRIATRDTEVGGTRILKGMVVRPSPLAPNYDPDVFPTRCASTSTASPSASCRSAPARITASATFSGAPRSRSRSAACWRASRTRISSIRISCRSMAVRSANCACRACR